MKFIFCHDDGNYYSITIISAITIVDNLGTYSKRHITIANHPSRYHEYILCLLNLKSQVARAVVNTVWEMKTHKVQSARAKTRNLYYTFFEFYRFSFFKFDRFLWSPSKYIVVLKFRYHLSFISFKVNFKKYSTIKGIPCDRISQVIKLANQHEWLPYVIECYSNVTNVVEVILTKLSVIENNLASDFLKYICI